MLYYELIYLFFTFPSIKFRFQNPFEPLSRSKEAFNLECEYSINKLYRLESWSFSIY